MTAAVPAGYRLRLDTRSAPVRVVANPHVWLVRLLTDTTSGLAGRLPRSLQARVSGSVRPSARWALHPFAEFRRGAYPESLTPITAPADVSVAQQVERMMDVSEDVVGGELFEAYGPVLPHHWRAAAEHPARWLRAMAQASTDAWTAVFGTWDASSALFTREQRRVGAAVVSGRTDALLNTLHPRLHYADGLLTLDANTDLCFDLADRTIALVPMIAGPDGLNVNFVASEAVQIAYPVPGGLLPGWPARRLADDAADPLSLVLGPLRADMLRRIERPVTVGRLAADTQCAPNTASYHCDQLQSAGLIARDRRGQRVWLRRTDSGDELVELLSA